MCLGLKVPFGENEERIMMVDKRRYGVIEVRFRPGPPAIYSLTIGGEQWAAVEWSAFRRTWCIEDAAGHCLAHCEHIHGDNIDRPTAIALAKGMILDGRIPPPEEAMRQLREQQGVEEDERIVEAAQDGMRQLRELEEDPPRTLPGKEVQPTMTVCKPPKLVKAAKRRVRR
jgi:hypothetical protein